MAPSAVMVGMPGSGKTTVGRAVAAALGCEFVDSDDVVVATTGRLIADIFADDGEAVFREHEADAVADLVTRDELVLSVGGGAVLHPATCERLAACPVVWLRASVDTLRRRMSDAEAADRPLLTGDIERRLTTLDAERRQLYADVAGHVVDVDGRTVDDVVDDVLASLRAGATP